MNRRKFIEQTAIVTCGMASMPSLLSAKQSGGIILGHNHKRYRIDTKWGALDFSRYPVKDCHEMVQDSNGRIILLTNETKNNVIIYDKKGKLITTWGSEYPGGHGLTLFNENGQEVLFICDNNRHQVIKTTLDGRVLLTLDYPKESGAYNKAEEYVPTETAIAPNGDIYVADGYGKDFIIQYNYKGKYIRHWGGRGNENKHLKNAHGICYDNRDKNNPVLIVTSREQNAFKKYSLDGQYIDTILIPGAWVCRPVIKGDFLYAAVLQSQSRQGQQSGFVTILDKNNKVVSNIAGSEPAYNNNVPDEMYQTIKAFQYPHDVCIDDEENLYVAQWNSGQVYPYKLTPVV
jgi:peptidylamidoglycolate lyase